MKIDVGRAADALIAAGQSLEPYLPEQYVPVRPHAKQAAFLCPPVTLVREVFYGGAVGGGKTAALLMAALQFVEEPGYSAVLVRRTYPMLESPGSLIPLAKEWLLGTDAEYNEGRHRWTFPSGATISFRHLDDDRALSDYQSAEYHFIGIDEVTDLTLAQFLFVMTRLRRRADSGIPLRVRSASNPLGRGKEWVQSRYVDSDKPDRLFISARLEDNPSLDSAEYEEVLRQLGVGSVMFLALREGRWDVKTEGKTFKRDWFPIVDADAVPADVRRVRFWDLAATETPKGAEAKRQGDPDFTVGLRLARSNDGVYYVEDVARFREGPAESERRMAVVRDLDGRSIPVRMEQEGGASGKRLISLYRRGMFDGFDFRGRTSSASKELRAAPVAPRAEAGEIVLVRGPWIEEFLDELAEFPDGLHDDQVDALSGAFAELAVQAPSQKAPPEPVSFTAGSHWLGH